MMPSLHDFFKNIFERARDAPLRVVAFHFAQVAVITNVIADAVLFKVTALLRLASQFFDRRKGFPDGAGILFAAANVINLAGPGRLAEGQNEIGYVFGVNIIANLLPLVAEDFVLAAFDITAHKIT